MKKSEDNSKKLWFKRKCYGWGWRPSAWQGWAVTLLYIAVVVLLGLSLDNDSPTREVFFVFILPTILLTITFVRIAYKTGERPRWQWGRGRE